MDAADGAELVADDDPLEALSLRELTAAVRLAVEGLPPAHRAVVLLHNLEGMSLRDVAEILEVPVGTAKSRLSAAFVMLRRSLREWREDDHEVR
jgi:RNA polymerase sigma-70 factor (ECF subfamily)